MSFVELAKKVMETQEPVLVTAGTPDQRMMLAKALSMFMKKIVVAVTPEMERKATANSVPKLPDEVTLIIAFGISTWHIIIDKKGNGASGNYSNLEEFRTVVSDFLVDGAVILVAGAPSRIPEFGDRKWVTTDSAYLVANLEARLRPKAFHIKEYLRMVPSNHKIVVGNPAFPGESYVTDTMEGGKFSGGNASDMAKSLGVDVPSLPWAIESYVASRK